MLEQRQWAGLSPSWSAPRRSRAVRPTSPPRWSTTAGRVRELRAAVQSRRRVPDAGAWPATVSCWRGPKVM